MEQAVEHGGDGGVVAEELSPVVDGAVGGAARLRCRSSTPSPSCGCCRARRNLHSIAACWRHPDAEDGAMDSDSPDVLPGQQIRKTLTTREAAPTPRGRRPLDSSP